MGGNGSGPRRGDAAGSDMPGRRMWPPADAPSSASEPVSAAVARAPSPSPGGAKEGGTGRKETGADGASPVLRFGDAMRGRSLPSRTAAMVSRMGGESGGAVDFSAAL